VDSNGRTIFVADALRGDRKRFVVRADEKLTAFVEKSPSRAGTPRQRVLSAKLSFCRNLFYLVVACPKIFIGVAVVGIAASRSQGCGIREPDSTTRHIFLTVFVTGCCVAARTTFSLGPANADVQNASGATSAQQATVTFVFFIMIPPMFY
jgi:hypothetical protein